MYDRHKRHDRHERHDSMTGMTGMTGKAGYLQLSPILHFSKNNRRSTDYCLHKGLQNWSCNSPDDVRNTKSN